jgi:hypothetical protein
VVVDNDKWEGPCTGICGSRRWSMCIVSLCDLCVLASFNCALGLVTLRETSWCKMPDSEFIPKSVSVWLGDAKDRLGICQGSKRSATQRRLQDQKKVTVTDGDQILASGMQNTECCEYPLIWSEYLVNIWQLIQWIQWMQLWIVAFVAFVLWFLWFAGFVNGQLGSKSFFRIR